MDYATLTDNNGKKADFRNVVLLMSSNAGAREMSTASIGFGPTTGLDAHASKGLKAVEKLFSPEFRNRLDGIITFHGLNLDIMEKVVDKFMKELETQLAARHAQLFSPMSGGCAGCSSLTCLSATHVPPFSEVEWLPGS